MESDPSRTGESTLTGGRLARVREYLNSTFCFTYGDGVANVDIQSLVDLHFKEGRQATLTAVQPPGRYGAIGLDGHQVTQFQENQTATEVDQRRVLRA